MSEPKNLTQIPQHVAIIMDGNRRWAAARNLPYIEGHKEALKQIEAIIRVCAQKKISYLTLWAWSTKNWKRNPDFINDILSLFREHLTTGGLFSQVIAEGAQLHHIGRLDNFPDDIKTHLQEFVFSAPKEKLIDVNLAIGYEGRDELIRAVKKIVASGIDPVEIDQELISKTLDTGDQPPVDLVIRTGGEKRTSGFLIWQAADAEFYFTDTLMPDFTVTEYEKALVDYSMRERRMGGDSKLY